MIIPTRITVGNHRYTIRMLKYMPRKGIMGTVHYDLGTIQLATHSNTSNARYSPLRLQETFWHEVTHAILEDMGQHELNRNEAFVTQFANRLTVAIKTAKFE